MQILPKSGPEGKTSLPGHICCHLVKLWDLEQESKRAALGPAIPSHHPREVDMLTPV